MLKNRKKEEKCCPWNFRKKRKMNGTFLFQEIELMLNY